MLKKINIAEFEIEIINNEGNKRNIVVDFHKYQIENGPIIEIKLVHSSYQSHCKGNISNKKISRQINFLKAPATRYPPGIVMGVKYNRYRYGHFLKRDPFMKTNFLQRSDVNKPSKILIKHYLYSSCPQAALLLQVYFLLVLVALARSTLYRGMSTPELLVLLAILIRYSMGVIDHVPLVL